MEITAEIKVEAKISYNDKGEITGYQVMDDAIKRGVYSRGLTLGDLEKGTIFKFGQNGNKYMKISEGKVLFLPNHTVSDRFKCTDKIYCIEGEVLS